MKQKKNVDLKIPKITQLPSGSFTTKVMIDGRRHTITRDTWQECAAEAAAIKYRSKQAEDNRRTFRTTLSEAVDQYIERRRSTRSPATIRGYVAYKENRLQDMMDANIFATTDKQWQIAVDRDFRGLTPKYAKNVWSMFASAIEEITGNRPKVELRRSNAESRPFLEPDEVLLFVDAMKGNVAYIAALLELSSLRISEVLDVRGTDVDLKKNRIRIRGAAVYGENGWVHKELNKNASSTRYIPIIPPLREALLSVELTDDYIVKLTRDNIYNQINRVCRKNGLPEVGNHGLRHSFASLAYHLQIPPKIVQEIGGWSDAATVNKIYTHLAQKDIAKRSEQFSNFFKKLTD